MADRRESGAVGSGVGDIGRRVTLRRQELGLSVEETASRAGTAPGYLRYLESQPCAAPGPGLLFRLAEALETSVNQLRGGQVDLPEGMGRAARRPELVELDTEECRARLSTHGVGRVAVSLPEGPVIIPVNYSMVDDAVVFATAPGSPAAVPAGTEAAFEVDRIDEAMSEGWSVLVVGHAEHVTDPEAVRRLAAAVYSGPWAGGTRDLWLRILPERLTGRRILSR
ncbi:helix-turn-helix domain-containing protein [Streptomyces sp. TP-A0874]|uniref:helix-turn-helix domain-containing protein n=1 Tax=Streptomyces sp. TP-A0874 TaxID=549819 RepID=UPI000A86BF14|nr:pyridoxamine 5'-phosphate oxidase family protein [Streptomyces sp. TP-A0874]